MAKYGLIAAVALAWTLQMPAHACRADADLELADVRYADVVIVGKRMAETTMLTALRRPDQTVIDLAGVTDLGNVLRPWSGSEVKKPVGNARA